VGDSVESFIGLLSESIAQELPVIRYYSLLFFDSLRVSYGNSDQFKGVESDIWSEVFEILRESNHSPLRGTFGSAFCSAMGRTLSKADIKVIGRDEQEILLNTLRSDQPDWQLTAFKVLHDLIPDQQEESSIELELKASSIDDSAENPAILDPILIRNLTTEEEHEVEESSRAYLELRYLLSWILAFDYFPKASFNLRRLVAGELRAGGRLDQVLNRISCYVVSATAKTLPAFDEFRDIDGVLYMSLDEQLRLLRFHVLYLALRYTGSQAKSWFLGLKKRNVSIAVENYVRSAISPHIIESELDRVQTSLSSSDGEEDGLDIKFSRSTREIRASYKVDMQSLDIAVKIPDVYPLRDIVIEGVQRVGVRENQWRAWLLASQALAASQNGTIRDALELFKRNASLHFSGVEECAICYSILHEDRSLPTKTCSTCKNKFHADCLYRWFKSAGNSTCPLCRSTFQFRRGFG
jgi:hypothetical protein